MVSKISIQSLMLVAFAAMVASHRNNGEKHRPSNRLIKLGSVKPPSGSDTDPMRIKLKAAKSKSGGGAQKKLSGINKKAAAKLQKFKRNAAKRQRLRCLGRQARCLNSGEDNEAPVCATSLLQDDHNVLKFDNRCEFMYRKCKLNIVSRNLGNVLRRTDSEKCKDDNAECTTTEVDGKNVTTCECNFGYEGNGFKCEFEFKWEAGFCESSPGVDQNSGVITLSLNDDMVYNPQTESECMAACLRYNSETAVTGCEYIWEHSNRGCYVHTDTVTVANGVVKHTCSLFNTA